MTDPATETKSMGLRADAQLAAFFALRLYNFTMTSKLRFHYRDSYVIGFYRDKTTSHHLPGLAKNAAPRR